MTGTPLSITDLAQFKRILEARIAELQRGVAQREEIAVEQSPDAVDEVQQASARALAILNIDRESKELQRARAALRRIHSGSFGICEDCEDQISLKRLAAIPWASLCVVCQETADSEGSRMLLSQRNEWYAGVELTD